MRNQTNKNKHKMTISSQNTRNGISEDPIFHIFWGECPQIP